MKYDFTTIMDRLGKDAIAVDIPHSGNAEGFFADARVKDGFRIIPMWVADMNFPTVPTIPEAIIERAKHPQSSFIRMNVVGALSRKQPSQLCIQP